MNCTHAAVAGLRLTPRGDTQWVIADPGHREGHASVSPSPAPPSCAVPGIGSWGWPRACTPVRRTCPSTLRARLDLDVSPAIGWRRSRLPTSSISYSPAGRGNEPPRDWPHAIVCAPGRSRVSAVRWRVTARAAATLASHLLPAPGRRARAWPPPPRGRGLSWGGTW